MTELPSLTRRQREAAVTRARQSLALTSGAGCGKTLVLARRFTELLLGTKAPGESPFDRFVALTFTDKAAMEMHSRVRDVLLEALGRSRDAGERQRLADWITELPTAHISTIHSFCAALLRRHAVAAGVDPAFSVLADELVQGQMESEASEEAVLAGVEAGQAEVLELLARAEVAQVADDVATLLGRRTDWQAADYADWQETLQRWKDRQGGLARKEIQSLSGDPTVAAEAKYLSAYPCADASDLLEVYRRERLALVCRLLESGSLSAEEFAALAQKPGRAGKAGPWGGAEARDRYRRRLSSFLERFSGLAECFLPLGELDAEAARALAALTRLAGDAIRRYEQVKRRAGVLDFDDLVLLTGRLLTENPSVRGRLRGRLSQLLIDECQDTDAYQLRMLWNLLTDGDKPPPDKLFIVGDLKQSIYRFRGAQAEAFSQLVGRFGEARIPLHESFRMHKAGTEFVNGVFGWMMRQYEPIESAREELPPAPSVEILLAECPPGAGADDIAEAQGHLAAARIAEMIGRESRVFDRRERRWRTVRAGDIAVLFARMTKSLQYEQALRQRDLPYYVVGGVGFFQQQEVFDVLNALAAVDNPYDDLAVMGVLRSGLVGLDDNALLHVAEAVRPPYFDRLGDPSLAKRLSPTQGRQLGFAQRLLSDLHRAKDALGPAGIIQRLLEATGYGGALLSEFHGRRKLGNVLRLLEAARAAERAGGLDLADFVRRYGEFVMSESRHEQAPVVSESEDVVRLMTIHKAKGLEFPVVILPDLNAGFGQSRDRLLFHPDWGLTYKSSALPDQQEPGEAESVSFRLARQAERQELEQEDIRKLYVGMTRHEDFLVLVGADVRSKDGSFKASGSYLARLDEVLGIAQAVDDQAGSITYGDGLRARVARLAANEPKTTRRRRPLGQRILAEAADPGEVARRLVEAGVEKPLPLIGPLLGPHGDGTGAPAGTVAATALADFHHCPMLFWWRYDLRVPPEAAGPPPARPGEPAAPVAGAGELDAATGGTVFHRCMEWLDFQAVATARPEGLAAMAKALVGRALAEMELTAPPEALAGELAAMLRAFAACQLFDWIRSARQRLREVDFLFRAGPLDISGQMDLLYQDADAAWHVVDYKSDRLQAGDVAEHARRYRVQMMLYLAAARRRLGEAVGDATLYFLRPHLTHAFAPGPEDFQELDEQVRELGAELVRCRRTGQFPRRQGRPCRFCPYGRLCLRSTG